MSIPTDNVPAPRCPYCSADLEELGTYQWTQQLGIGLGMILSVYCSNRDCRKLIHTQIFIVPNAEEKGRIVGPH